MHRKVRLIWAACLALTVSNKVANAQPAHNSCNCPPGLHDVISAKYPDTSLVTSRDLSQDSRKLFQKEHGTRCPGLVRVNFYGDGKPTWALVLISKKSENQKTELVVAHQIGKEWDTQLLEAGDAAPVPVAWREKPGKYEGMSEPRTIVAANPVIILCGYGSWSRLYAWTGKDVVKLQITD